jgi:hypothetical protein
VAQREARGTDLRKSIAAAAWRLRRAKFPPQVRAGDRFAISPGSVSRFKNVDRFEARDLIQRVHARKRAQMLAEVRRVVEGMERSPFVEANGRPRLPAEIFEQPLQAAVRLAYRDADYLALLTELHGLWHERTKPKDAAQAKKDREAAQRRARMQPGIQKVMNGIERQVRTGNWPRIKVNSILDHVSTMAEAIKEGRLVMRSTPTGDYLWFASEGLPIIAGMLADTAAGRAVLIELGKLTLKEPLAMAALPHAWMAPAQRVQEATKVERDDGQVASRGKDGPEI